MGLMTVILLAAAAGFGYLVYTKGVNGAIAAVTVGAGTAYAAAQGYFEKIVALFQ